MADRTDRIQQFLSGLFDDERLSKLGLATERIIRVRTREGKDVKGQPFPSAEDSVQGSPYSRGWYRARQKKGLATDTKNLQFTLAGGMMRQMTHRVLTGADKGTEVYFQGERAEQLARYHNVEGVGINKMKHVFFGTSKDEKERIRALFEDDINDLMRDLRLT